MEMWKVWTLICSLVAALLYLAYLIFIFCGMIKQYKHRYARCLVELDEALLDVIRSTRIVMETTDCQQPQIDAVMVETVEKNHLVQRIFETHHVLYISQTSRRWISKRLEIVKKANTE